MIKFEQLKVAKMPSESEFNKLKLKEKFELLKKEGEFIASRVYQSYNVHLFSLDGFYVEVYRTIGLGYINWIEIVTSRDRLENYVGQIDIDDLLGK